MSILYLSESQKKTAIAWALLSECHTGVSQAAAAAEQGQSPWPCSWENQRHGVVPLVLYLGVTAPGRGCSLFIGKGKKCNDAQQGDLC